MIRKQIDRNKLEQLIRLTASFETGMALISNRELNHSDKYSSFEALIATGVEKYVEYKKNTSFYDALKDLVNMNNEWIFGHLGYDLKNETENLRSENPDNINFPMGFFFIPQNIIQFRNGKEFIIKKTEQTELKNNKKFEHNTKGKTLKSRLNTDEYINIVKKLKEHIHRGDIFEVNFCYEYYIKGISIDPVETFILINEISPMPFAGFYKYKNNFLLCFSPERFLKKLGNKIISQPMKGTIKRGQTEVEDKIMKNFLLNDKKERMENIMITDLVRNDLSRTSKNGSVKVEELCSVYEFKQVYQMISTITSELDDNFQIIDVIKNAFPMGSMTGAPKVKAMELIEKYEKSRRGLYSGSIGYITPDKDFDFNVVIRSICYNLNKKYLNFMVGSAITSLSIPEKELEECILKAKALQDWLLGEK